MYTLEKAGVSFTSVPGFVMPVILNRQGSAVELHPRLSDSKLKRKTRVRPLIPNAHLRDAVERPVDKRGLGPLEKLARRRGRVWSIRWRQP